MRVAMIGTGYVGLVSGTCFADFGHVVTCIDKDASKIDALNNGQIPIYEPGLQDLVAKNVAEERLFFTTSPEEAIRDADAVFIAVGTPTRRGDGHAETSNDPRFLRLPAGAVRLRLSGTRRAGRGAGDCGSGETGMGWS